MLGTPYMIYLEYVILPEVLDIAALYENELKNIATDDING